MRARMVLLALGVAAAALPAALPAQEEEIEVIRTDRRQDGGWMGIRFQWDDDDARQARVAEVVDGSPAERAGVRAGDVVLSIDGEAATEDAVAELSRGLDAGDRVRLRIRRDGREQEVVVVAERRPERVALGRGPAIIRREGGPAIIRRDGDRTIVIRTDSIEAHMDSLLSRMDSLRFEIRDGRRLEFRRGGREPFVIRVDTMITTLRDSLLRHLPREIRVPELRELRRGEILPYFFEFGPRSVAGAEFAEMNEGLGRYFRTSQGLLVLQVGPNTPAARAGLEAGDVVTRVNGEAVESIGDLRDEVFRAEDGRLRLDVLRQGQRREVQIQWERPRGTRFRIETDRDGEDERVRIRETERARPRTRTR